MRLLSRIDFRIGTFSKESVATENAYIESFNGMLRLECLRQHWFTSLAEARQIVEGWRQDYNHVRPHRSLGQQTPAEVLKQHEINTELSLEIL